MKPERADETQRGLEEPRQTFEMGSVSEETKGVSGNAESLPAFKNG
jgi:hypothetical protein